MTRGRLAIDKVITTVLLTIAGVVAAMLFFGAVVPAIGRGSGAVVSVAGRIDERIKTQINILHEAYDSDTYDVFIWVKNVGASRITAVEDCDIFFGPEGDYSRIPYNTGDPHWDYAVEGGGEWKPGRTVKFTIDYSSALASGTYFVKIATPNGVSDEDYFSV